MARRCKQTATFISALFMPGLSLQLGDPRTNLSRVAEARPAEALFPLSLVFGECGVEFFS
jgi:hypothetical protein